MSVSLVRRTIEENTWQPNLLGVNFTEIMAKRLGEAALQGVPLWTAWAVVETDSAGEGYEFQVTQDNCEVLISDFDDDSDTILLLDRRDSMYWRYNRLNHAAYFDNMVQIVAPWSKRTSSMVPTELAYKAVLEQLAGDVEQTDHIPDDWA